MKTSSCLSNKVKQNFEKFFDKNNINRIARAAAFVCRKGARITPFAFVVGLIQCCCSRANTYSNWAAVIGTITGKEVSKQALFKRMNEHSVAFARQLFEQVLAVRLKASNKATPLFQRFGQVLLADSTTLSLPQPLAEAFPGAVAHGVQKATARLQCVVNLRTMQCLDVSLDAFRDNDQGASGKVVSMLTKGDLLIRDMGYFVLKVLRQVMEAKAFFITRIPYGLNWYDPKSGKQINWKELLPSKNQTVADRWIVIGRDEQVPVRVMLIPLPPQQAEQRIRKAKADRDRRLNHSEDYYRWISYNVFITNVERDILSARQAAEVYGVRWMIELLFKAWKSGGNLQAVLHQGCTNVHRVKTTIYLMLVFYCLVMQHFYVRHARSVEQQSGGKFLSLLKLLTFACNHLQKIISASAIKRTEMLVSYCCYEQRNDRVNIIQFIGDLC